MLTRYAQKNVTWIDLVAPTPEEVRSLMKEFDLSPGVAQELLVRSFKSKVERSGDTLYIILHFPTIHGVTPRPQQEIDFVIGKHFLITTRYETIDPLHSFARSFEVEAMLGRSHVTHAGHVFIDITKSLYAGLVEECDSIEATLENIEEHIFEGHEKQMVAELSLVGKTLHDFRQALLPHQEMLTSLEPAATRMFGSEFLYYLHDLEGSLRRASRAVENLRDALGELRETNNSLLSTKQNEIMQAFTAIAFLFLPLSFINGLFQMNTRYTPLVGMTGDFWYILGGMLLMVTCCFIFFKKKGWL